MAKRTSKVKGKSRPKSKVKKTRTSSLTKAEKISLTKTAFNLLVKDMGGMRSYKEWKIGDYLEEIEEYDPNDDSYFEVVSQFWVDLSKIAIKNIKKSTRFKRLSLEQQKELLHSLVVDDYLVDLNNKHMTRLGDNIL